MKNSLLPRLIAVAAGLFTLAFAVNVEAQTPFITGFSPTTAAVGSTVFITGGNFIPPLSITFGGNVQAAGSFTSSNITVTVPSGTQTGTITVATANGSATTTNAFTVGTNLVIAFFAEQASLGSGVYYLSFVNSNIFGYYSYLSSSNYIYHFDAGYEYYIDAQDGKSGVYFYDFTSGHFWYTSPTFPFPYVYDFTLGSTLYYYPDTHNAGHYTKNPRYFFDFATNGIITE